MRTFPYVLMRLLAYVLFGLLALAVVGIMAGIGYSATVVFKEAGAAVFAILLIAIGLLWGLKRLAERYVLLAHCGDWVSFGVGEFAELRIENLSKSGSSLVRVGIGGETKTLAVRTGEPCLQGVENKFVKVRLLESGSGGPCRGEVAGDCGSAPRDSDVRVRIPHTANNIQRCHIETAATCLACGCSLQPPTQ